MKKGVLPPLSILNSGYENGKVITGISKLLIINDP